MKTFLKWLGAGLLLVSAGLIQSAEINDLNVTDASNTGRFPENMAPSAVNDGARALEGLLARWHENINASIATTGSANAYVLDARGTQVLFDGLELCFDANFANTGAATLNVDATGAINLRKYNDQALASGDIEVGQKVCVVYDGTNFQIISSLAAVGEVAVQVFLADGTYTKPADLLFAIVELVGAGAAGGGGAATAAGECSTGGGGGAGGYSREILAASAIGATETVTVGAGGTGVVGGTGNSGGTTSFGALLSATGGLGGTAAAAGVSSVGGGGSTAAGSGGDVNLSGGEGGMGNGHTSANVISGFGGVSFYGGGAQGVEMHSAGRAGTAPGSGGSGGALGASQAAVAGGAGAAGIVIVTEFRL